MLNFFNQNNFNQTSKYDEGGFLSRTSRNAGPDTKVYLEDEMERFTRDFDRRVKFRKELLEQTMDRPSGFFDYVDHIAKRSLHTFEFVEALDTMICKFRDFLKIFDPIDEDSAPGCSFI